jgi:hypothetical protein
MLALHFTCSKRINGSTGCKPDSSRARLLTRQGHLFVSFSCPDAYGPLRCVGRATARGSCKLFCTNRDLPAVGWPQYTAVLMSGAFASSFHQFWYLPRPGRVALVRPEGLTSQPPTGKSGFCVSGRGARHDHINASARSKEEVDHVSASEMAINYTEFERWAKSSW